MTRAHSDIRTRFAPSPTGPLHVGGVRTALFNFLFARQAHGKFFLRIEDTDRDRSDVRFEDDIISGLRWLGLDWDEMLRQSERTELYEKSLHRLLEEKKIFWCPHTTEELAREREIQMQNKQPPRHNCALRDGQYVPDGEVGILRFKNNAEGKIHVHDIIRGNVAFQAELFGDFSIAKNFRLPLYNFAVVVDDAQMRISHVIRGEDHLPNTPKQILLQRALGITAPVYAHLPLIFGEDRSKLSKRHGAVSVNEYRKDGYLAPALLNFIALLGWHGNNDRERYGINELRETFALQGVQKGGAVFNAEKLNWMNREYIQELAPEAFGTFASPFLKEAYRAFVAEHREQWQKIIALIQPRLTKLSEINDHSDFFFEQVHYPKELLLWKSTVAPDDARMHIESLLRLLGAIDDSCFSGAVLREHIMPYAEAQEGGRGVVLWAFRVALSGKRGSPDPFDIASVIGKTATLSRLAYARALL